MVPFIAILVITFVLMECVSYVVHRFIYHGIAWKIHRSHHVPRKGAFELNDLFPAFFTVISIGLMTLALQEPVSTKLLAGTIGVTLYGIVYFIVHDLYIHKRVRHISLGIPLLARVKKAHIKHHRHGGEPYGLLFFMNAQSQRGGAGETKNGEDKPGGNPSRRRGRE